MRIVSISVLLAACGGDAVTHLPDAPPVVACAPSGTPMTHAGTIAADETWAAGIHEVTATVTVTAGTLTIAPCSEVRVAANASIELDQSATALVAAGTAAAPIRFVRAAAAAPWGHLFAFAPSRLMLAYVTLDGGGTAGDYKTAEQLGATLVVRGDPTLPQTLSVDHVTVTGSSGIAVFLNAARFTAGATALAISGAGFYPILAGVDSANDLPDGTYTGNAQDAILLQSAGTAAAFEQGRTLVANVTLHDRGVPYQVGVLPAEIVVGDNVDGHPPVTLTIEAGVTLRFVPEGTSGSSRIQVRGTSSGIAQGGLVAVGTAAKPIRFTSSAATPAAGDWQGIELRNAVDPATRIDHAMIEYAGGPSYATGVCEWKTGTGDPAELAALIISLAPNLVPTALMTNTAVTASAGSGVYRGWHATDVDFLTSNTFTSVAGCRETNIPNANNLCPTTACP